MLRIFVSNKKDSLTIDHPAGALEFGRVPRPGTSRVVLSDPYVSSSHLRVEELPGNQIKFTNLSQSSPVVLADGSRIEIGGSLQLALPARMTIGESLIEIQAGMDETFDTGALETVAQPLSQSSAARLRLMESITGSPSPEQLTQWFESFIAIQRAAAGSANFYHEISQAVVELIGLEYALFLLRKGEDWEIISGYARDNSPRMEFSRSVLGRVLAEKQTFYQVSSLTNHAQSLAGVMSVVASPIFDSEGKRIIGALYAAKGNSGRAGSEDLRPLHAQLVQVLAAAAGSGMARMESETQAARRLVQFEQFFSRELAQELDRNPALLEGQECEVTILSSDLRGFSRIAEHLSPRDTCLLLGDVMERLTTRIKEFGGVVVDYAGDGMMAMWNAPIAQPDHATRACRAALAMQAELVGLNQRWAGKIQGKLALGVGINSGIAMVGNTGSIHQLKYGPLGNSVNLASRIEGATKHLGVPVLITESTFQKTRGEFATRRICKVRVVNIETPVLLLELHAERASQEWLSFRDTYEKALEIFETGDLAATCRTIFPLLEDQGNGQDRPSLILASRAIDGMKSVNRTFDPVLSLETK